MAGFESCKEAAAFFGAHRTVDPRLGCWASVWGTGETWYYNDHDGTDSAWEWASGPVKSKQEAELRIKLAEAEEEVEEAQAALDEAEAERDEILAELEALTGTVAE